MACHVVALDNQLCLFQKYYPSIDREGDTIQTTVKYTVFLETSDKIGPLMHIFSNVDVNDTNEVVVSDANLIYRLTGSFFL